MTTNAKKKATGSESRPAKAAKKSAQSKPRASSKAAPAKPIKAEERSATDVAIATELAPAVAIALLQQSEHGDGKPASALEPLAAGAVSSDVDGQLRVQLLFENGSVLPVELSEEAAAALAKGIEKALPSA